jgi:hypothetical protein
VFRVFVFLFLSAHPACRPACLHLSVGLNARQSCSKHACFYARLPLCSPFGRIRVSHSQCWFVSQCFVRFDATPECCVDVQHNSHLCVPSNPRHPGGVKGNALHRRPRGKQTVVTLESSDVACGSETCRNGEYGYTWEADMGKVKLKFK